MRKTRLRVYCHSNTDGLYANLVAAENQRDAADRMNVSVGSLRREGRRLDAAHVDAELALSRPGVVFRRRLGVWPMAAWKATDGPTTDHRPAAGPNGRDVTC